MKNIVRLIAVLICVIISVLSFSACGDKEVSSDASSGASSAVDSSTDTSSKGEAVDMDKPEAVMFDNDLNTYWKPANYESDSIEFSLSEEKTFNTINFVEKDDIVTDVFVEIKKNGEWVEIFHSDEMGKRTAILDKTYTAKDIRITLSLMKEEGGICGQI